VTITMRVCHKPSASKETCTTTSTVS
jgi:hypothetical protein